MFVCNHLFQSIVYYTELTQIWIIAIKWIEGEKSEVHCLVNNFGVCKNTSSKKEKRRKRSEKKKTIFITFSYSSNKYNLHCNKKHNIIIIVRIRSNQWYHLKRNSRNRSDTSLTLKCILNVNLAQVIHILLNKVLVSNVIFVLVRTQHRSQWKSLRDLLPFFCCWDFRSLNIAEYPVNYTPMKRQP